MKTSRTDITRDNRSTKCPNSSLLGHSSYTLRPGDLFCYEEKYTDGTSKRRHAKCRGRVKPANDGTWAILAQVMSINCQHTYERWVLPGEVMEIIPQERADKNILAFYAEQEGRI